MAQALFQRTIYEWVRYVGHEHVTLWRKTKARTKEARKKVSRERTKHEWLHVDGAVR